MESHSLRTLRTAHYYTLGNPSSATRVWIIACHGYGQLARNLLRKFEGLESSECFILAPEGLSRFYWQGLSGEVAASWMTREDRLEEIEDYCLFLSTLYRQYRLLMPPGVRIVLLGFSQGCSTILRWAMRDFPDFQDMVLWAGSVPDDLDYLPREGYWEGKKIHVFYGDEDPFITEELISKQIQLLEQTRITPHVQKFAGKHTIDREVLRNWVAENFEWTGPD